MTPGRAVVEPVARTEVLGRDDILAAAWDTIAAGGGVLLEGPAGIGKTAVWRALGERARAAGFTVVSCAPTDFEAEFPLSALADLLGPVAVHADGLPAPQRDSLRAALTPGSGQVDEHALAAGVRGMLAALGERTLVAIDDLPWLDPPSERALRFALRRARVGVLLSRRPAAGDPLGLPDLVRLEVPPLGTGALFHLLRQRLGARLGRPLLVRVIRECGGNALLAIELTRALMRLPRLPRADEDLPVAVSVRDLVDARVRALPEAAREAVRLAALLAVPTVSALRAAGVPQGALDQAEEAGLLAAHPDVIAFGHPLHAAAVRAGIPPGVRRGLHRRLAGAVADADERARQLAAGAEEPDAAVSDALAAAARGHRDRGASETAAALWDRAAALHPDPTAAVAHRIAAERARFDSGDYSAAAEGASALAAAHEGTAKAQALLLLAEVRYARDDIDGASEAASAGLAACPDGTVAGLIHANLAVFLSAPEAAGEHARRAAELLSADDEHQPLTSAVTLLEFYHQVRAGLPPRTELLERGLALEGPRPLWLAATVPGIYWKCVDEHDLARERFAGLLDRAVAHGDEPAQHDLLSQLGEAEVHAGRYADAEARIRAAHDLGVQLGTGLIGENWLSGLLDACRGDLDSAARVAEAGIAEGAESGDTWALRLFLGLAGFTALSAGRMAEAAAHYGRLAAAVDGLGLREPLSLRFEADWAEACVGAGDLDGAEAALARLAGRHERLPRPWTTLGLARGRVLVDAARGREPAIPELLAARDSVAADVVPLERARCLLAAGVVLRRTRRRTAARDALAAAEAEFTALGAAAFAARAAAEATRLGARRAVGTDLSPTEARVARLAAAGGTNRAIAEQLFLSPKTVEANLARVYRKLGIASRAELGAVMATLPG